MKFRAQTYGCILLMRLEFLQWKALSASAVDEILI